MSFYYWVIQPLDVLPDKKFSTFRVHPSIWCEQKYWDSFLTGLSEWSDVSGSLIIQILKAGNVSYQLYPLLLYSESCIRWWHTNQDEDEGAGFVRKASNVDAKRKDEVN